MTNPLVPALTDALLAAGVALAGVLTLAARRLARRLRDVQADTASTRRQVQNSHRTNLREDIDALSAQLTGITSTLGRIEGRLDADRDAAVREHKNLWSAVNDLRYPNRKEPK